LSPSQTTDTNTQSLSPSTITDKSKKVALITGITGQDGSYLAEFLLKKGYEVHGMKRRSSLFNTDRIDHLYQDPHEENVDLTLHFGDMTDSMNITKIIQEVQPDEIYNLAAMSHVAVSFETPEYVSNADGTGTLRILEAVKLLGLTKKTRIYQASTSELYGKVQEVPQTETTPFYPRSPYAVAKMYAYWITVNYREAYDMFACNGILFNHESPVRGETFVTRKITRAASKIALGLQDKLLVLLWFSMRRYLSRLFFSILLLLLFSCAPPPQSPVPTVDPRYFRPTEVDLLIGDPSKAEKKLGWTREYKLDELVNDMMASDLQE